MVSRRVGTGIPLASSVDRSLVWEEEVGQEEEEDVPICAMGAAMATVRKRERMAMMEDFIFDYLRVGPRGRSKVGREKERYVVERVDRPAI